MINVVNELLMGMIKIFDRREWLRLRTLQLVRDDRAGNPEQRLAQLLSKKDPILP